MPALKITNIQLFYLKNASQGIAQALHQEKRE